MKEKVKVLTVKAKDCEWDYFRAGGKGGQGQNKRSTGVRVTHRASGAVGEARDSRDQLQNRREAWRRMAESKAFQDWAKKEAAGHQQSIADKVKEWMNPSNLLIEFYDPQIDNCALCTDEMEV